MRQLLCAATIFLTSPLSLAGNTVSELHQMMSSVGRHHVELGVGSPDQQTIMPITVLVGPEPGPTLLVLSGTHGSEYSPIVASQRLGVNIDPDDLSGKVLFVHIANMPAYLGRSIYVNPVDGKNLNRVFPGHPEGSLSERLAHLLTHDLYPLADAVLDVHSGDGNEDLYPFWTGYYGKAGNPAVIAKSKAMAMAFGFEHVVEFQWELTDIDAAIWAGSAAVARDIPSIDVEAGGKGIVDPVAVQGIESGIKRVMALLGISKEKHLPPPAPILIKERSWISAPVDGSWMALKPAGTRVLKGETLGYLTDWFGRRLFEAKSPSDGLLLLTLSAPPVRKGETLAVVAKLQHRIRN